MIKLVVGSLGLVSAVIGSYVAGKRQADLERARELRLAIASLARPIGQAAHSMAWLTWKARYRKNFDGLAALYDAANDFDDVVADELAGVINAQA